MSHLASMPLFRVRKPRPVGVVRDNGSAGHLSLLRNDGVLGKLLPDTLHARPKTDRLYATFWIYKDLLSIPDHYSSTPLLHCSNNPGTWRLAFGPLPGGLQTKPRSLGVDSLLSSGIKHGGSSIHWWPLRVKSPPLPSAFRSNAGISISL